jgi:hypothetical protein
MPVVVLVDAAVGLGTARPVFGSTPGLLVATVPVLILELSGRRPRLVRAAAFSVVAFVTSSLFALPLAAVVPTIGPVVARGLALAAGLAVTTRYRERLGSSPLALARDALRTVLPPPAGTRER